VETVEILEVLAENDLLCNRTSLDNKEKKKYCVASGRIFSTQISAISSKKARSLETLNLLFSSNTPLDKIRNDLYSSS
jgi:hypothetical protein